MTEETPPFLPVWNQEDEEEKAMLKRVGQPIIFYIIIVPVAILVAWMTLLGDFPMSEKTAFGVFIFALLLFPTVFFLYSSIDFTDKDGWIDIETYRGNILRAFGKILMLVAIAFTYEILLSEPSQESNDDWKGVVVLWVVVAVLILLPMYSSRMSLEYKRIYEGEFSDYEGFIQNAFTTVLPAGDLTTKFFIIVKDGDTHLRGAATKGGDIGITVQTPRDQPERNRELREAVGAILEGRG